MVEQNGFDNAFTTDEYRRLRQRLDEDAIRNLKLCYSHYLHPRYCERPRGVCTPDIVRIWSQRFVDEHFPGDLLSRGLLFSRRPSDRQRE